MNAAFNYLLFLYHVDLGFVQVCFENSLENSQIGGNPAKSFHSKPLEKPILDK